MHASVAGNTYKNTHFHTCTEHYQQFAFTEFIVNDVGTSINE